MVTTLTQKEPLSHSWNYRIPEAAALGVAGLRPPRSAKPAGDQPEKNVEEGIAGASTTTKIVVRCS